MVAFCLNTSYTHSPNKLVTMRERRLLQNNVRKHLCLKFEVCKELLPIKLIKNEKKNYLANDEDDDDDDGTGKRKKKTSSYFGCYFLTKTSIHTHHRMRIVQRFAIRCTHTHRCNRKTQKHTQHSRSVSFLLILSVSFSPQYH